jgi:hypothetical protein
MQASPSTAHAEKQQTAVLAQERVHLPSESVHQTSERRPSEWQKLPPALHNLTPVVQFTSEKLEKTTVLTWMYLNEGSISYETVAKRVIRPSIGAQRRYARRVLRTLERMGVLYLCKGDGSNPELVSDAEEETDAGEDLEVYAEVAEQENDSEGEPRQFTSVQSVKSPVEFVPLESGTTAHLTKAGMLWLQRAWRARSVSLCRESPGIEFIHQSYLEEEEEGKGGELVWIEPIGAKDNLLAQKEAAGLITKWMERSVTSVFDLGAIKSAKPRTAAKLPSHHSRSKYRD